MGWRAAGTVLSLVGLVGACMPASAEMRGQAPVSEAGDAAPLSVTRPVVREQVFDLSVGQGARQRVLLCMPRGAKGTIIMLPGGSGRIGLGRDGGLRHGANFVVRTRTLWAGQGYAVLIPDAVDQMNLRGTRSSTRYAGIVAELIGFARAHMPGPVFLLGTSQGAIAAMNGAVHAPADAVAGLVLTEAVSVIGGSHETVFSAEPQRVRVPVLIVANRDDRCDVAPPEAAPKIAAALTGSRDVRVLMLSGGLRRATRACDSLTPHGYYGIEGRTVEAISRWMDNER